MSLEEIDKWLDNEYGMSYTKLEELHNYFFEKYTDQKEEIERLNKENKILRENAEHNDKVVDKVNWENKRLNNIINELERYINEEYIYDELGMKIFDASKLQDKLQELKGEINEEN